jgi:Cu-processing system ATP-binding protein
MIRVAGLTKKYGRFKAVDDLSFDVASGEGIALWGPNGAGKTTVIRSLLGLVRCKGTIEIAGLDARKRWREARRAIGYVPQEMALYDDLRVSETISFFAGLKRVSAQRAAASLEQVDLAEHRRKRVRELSGGMKQRLVLALAQLTDPPIMILDEPTSNLDAAGREAFVAALAHLNQSGKTVLFSSHRVQEVRRLASRVVVLERGRLKTVCTPAQLAEQTGLRCMMRVFVEHDRVQPAVDALVTSGYAARQNGRGLIVEVDPLEKAGPLRVLGRENIGVSDFELGPMLERNGGDHV